VIELASYAEDRWLPAGGGRELTSAIDSVPVAALPRAPADPAAMLSYARRVGGPGLRRLGFRGRGKLLRALADAISARKEQLYELSFATGATRSDSAFDIEGGLGVLFVYASKAKTLPDGQILRDGDREVISKGNFFGQHILSPMSGAAVHINAYNFPVWGLLEKLAPTLLAGMPVVVKPASPTAWVAAAVFRIMIDSGLLPPGSVQLLLGDSSTLLDELDWRDVVAFTGSAATAAKLRTHPNVVGQGVRFSAEQDSLNASMLGPDAAPGSPEFDLFVREVAREMTQKAGQKCTAIRRAVVPARYLDAVELALVGHLDRVVIGDPRVETVRLGALAGLQQRDDVRRKVDLLRREADVVTGDEPRPLIGADYRNGAFLAPILLRCNNPTTANLVHSEEAFGPVSTLMPYETVDDAIQILEAGHGSLVHSLFSHDRDVVAETIVRTASAHGRIAVIDRDSAQGSTGHGAALPHLVHGGPGRAGGGEELGGLNGMKHYMQRTALQGSAELLDALDRIEQDQPGIADGGPSSSAAD
jgi:oxepin-CoA hydrolase/3-oxo-5,6-dehydrosuberyl-CoA semialdehyde dehydrogenase